MALFWIHEGPDGFTTIRIEDPAIADEEGLLKRARNTPNVHYPYRNGERLTFMAVDYTIAMKLVELFADYLGLELQQVWPSSRQPVRTLIDNTRRFLATRTREFALRSGPPVPPPRGVLRSVTW